MTGLVSTFLTHDGGRALTRGVVADRRHEAVDPGAIDLRGLALLAPADADACAYGKIVVIGRHGISTFQAMSGGATAPVFCGNSTAAAISCLGGAGSLSTRVHGVAAEPYEVTARIDGGLVAQTWMVPAAVPHEQEWHGCRAVFLPALNDYALVFGDLPGDAESARLELLGADPACKLAVIGADGMVAFYNSNGRHGGAPQTGLATIALATRSVPWLAAMFGGGFVSYRTASGVRRARLPAASEAGDRIAVEMPTVSVDLAPVAMERVA